MLIWLWYYSHFAMWESHPQLKQRRNGIRWRPGQESSLVPPCLSLRSFGSKCTVLKKVAYLWYCWDFPASPAVIRLPGNWSLVPLVTPLSQERSFPSRKVTWLSWQCHQHQLESGSFVSLTKPTKILKISFSLLCPSREGVDLLWRSCLQKPCW